MASKGIEYSLSSWPASKANRVMVSALLSTMVRMTMGFWEYSIESAGLKGSEAGKLCLSIL